MKKMNLTILALLAMATTATQATESAAAQAEACCASHCAEEQAFAAKLGEHQRHLFDSMNAEQRQAVIAASRDSAQTADEAVEKIMREIRFSAAAEATSEAKQ